MFRGDLSVSGLSVYHRSTRSFRRGGEWQGGNGAEELQELTELRKEGLISEEEYEEHKAAVLFAVRDHNRRQEGQRSSQRTNQSTSKTKVRGVQRRATSPGIANSKIGQQKKSQRCMREAGKEDGIAVPRLMEGRSSPGVTGGPPVLWRTQKWRERFALNEGRVIHDERYFEHIKQARKIRHGDKVSASIHSPLTSRRLSPFQSLPVPAPPFPPPPPCSHYHMILLASLCRPPYTGS
eukprot:COSAG05_NODE_6437_length_958_cov_1.023283_2_plen_236_part_01